MGTTCVHRDKGMTDREFFEREFPDTLKAKGEILDCTTVAGAFYAAVRTKESGEVWGLVIKITRVPKDYYNYCYKEMSEDMGPGYHDCPERILDLLTPTESEWANQWRESCRRTIARKAEARKIKPGTVLHFAHPMGFSNGQTYQDFRFVERSTFVALDANGNYGTWVRISNWKQNAFEVVA